MRPDHVETLTALASVLDQLGRPDEAIQYLQRAAALAPDPFRSLLEMGDLLLEQGAYGEAIQALREAVKLRADRHNAFALLAAGVRWRRAA